MRIIVIDDSAAVRARLLLLLSESHGVEVVAEARDAHEALSLVEEHSPHTVILDLHVPGTRGFELLRALKAGPRAPRVIVLTNQAEEAYRRECLKHGADHFLDKSNDFHRILEAVAATATDAS